MIYLSLSRTMLNLILLIQHYSEDSSIVTIKNISYWLFIVIEIIKLTLKTLSKNWALTKTQLRAITGMYVHAITGKISIWWQFYVTRTHWSARCVYTCVTWDATEHKGTFSWWRSTLIFSVKTSHVTKNKDTNSSFLIT